MSNEFETEKPFVVTTADMLEIVAGGGNGVEYVDITGLMETAAKELREKDAEIEQLRNNQSILITSFRINMMRLCPDYSHEEFDKDIADMLKEKE